MSWPYHITTCPTKTIYMSSNLLLQVLRGCYGLLERTVLTYHTKTTMVIYQVCYFNLLQGPAPASHLYAKLVACLSVEPVSCTWTCMVGLGHCIPKYHRIKIRCWWRASHTGLCNQITKSLLCPQHTQYNGKLYRCTTSAKIWRYKCKKIVDIGFCNLK